MYKSIGGGRIGWVNATFPLVTMTADAEHLSLKMFPLTRYRFRRDQIVALHARPGFLFGRIAIEHAVPDYPKTFIFYCDADSVLSSLAKAGFTPEGKPASRHPGVPFRWITVIGGILLWNGLFLLARQSPREGLLPPKEILGAMASIFAFCAAMTWIAPARVLLMKKGRSFDQVKPLVHLLTFVSGGMLAMLAFGRLVFGP